MSDPVHSPDHYQGDGIEAIEVIEGFGCCYHLGNALKYILRCHKKGAAIQDLRKAIWYLNREIGLLEKGVRCNHMKPSSTEATERTKVQK